MDVNEVIKALTQNPDDLKKLHDEIVTNKILTFLNPELLKNIIGLDKTPEFGEPDPSLSSFLTGGPMDYSVSMDILRKELPGIADHVTPQMLEDKAQLELLSSILAAETIGEIAKNKALKDLL